GQEPRFRCADRREALERRRGSVVVDGDPVEERGRRPARANRVELVVRRLDRSVHTSLCIGEEVLDRAHPASLALDYGVEMIVPTRSPAATRRMLPSASSKT